MEDSNRKIIESLTVLNATVTTLSEKVEEQSDLMRELIEKVANISLENTGYGVEGVYDDDE